VEGLGQIGKADLAVQMVKQMEERGIVAVPGVFYALAVTLCTCGKWEDALLQVDRIATLSGRPVVETYTGLIKACKDSGRWQDALSIFEHMQAACAPNIGCYNLVLSIYAQRKMYEDSKNLFDVIKKGRVGPPQLYRQDPRLSPDMFTYEAMLGACATSEKWDDLEVLFRQMLLQGYQLNSKRHAWIVQAISDAGKVRCYIRFPGWCRYLLGVCSRLPSKIG
jgi:pentatricopeptide repeat protein